MDEGRTSTGPDNLPATADQACNECRRRKSKCNRTLPTCGHCQKFRRNCLYEKQWKTPLTRRHLTEVEEELARAKALLREVLPQSRHESQSTPWVPQRAGSVGSEPLPMSFGNRTFGPLQNTADNNLESILPPSLPSFATSIQPGSYPPASNYQFTGQAQPELQPFPPTRGAESPSSVNSSSRDTKATSFSLESPPVSGGFDWDERTKDEGDDKFIDGMASLSESNEGGYLGIASGAVLVRMAEGQEHPSGRGSVSNRYPNHHHSDIPFAITSPSQLDPFIDAYFRLYHVSYPIVHEATFRAQFHEVIPRPTQNAWQVLLYTIAAIGAFTASLESTDVDMVLFKAAKARMSIDMFETGNLILVQVLTLMANYLQKRNKPNSGYNYLGLSRRIAMGIGLHKEFPNWNASPLVLEIRRRTWWCLYIFDIGAAITFSRPVDIPDRGIEVELPLNVHDSDITAATRVKPPEATGTTIYTHCRVQATFHLTTMQIYSCVISTPFPSATQLIELDDALIGQWLASIPPYYQEHVPQQPKYLLCHSIMRWRYRNLRLLMYRPFILRRIVLKRKEKQRSNNLDSLPDDPKVEIAVQRCLDAASETVDLITAFWNQNEKTMLACWYGLYFLFQAIMVAVVCLRNDPLSPPADGWRQQIRKAIFVIEDMARMNQAAERCLEVIRSLCGSYLTPETDGWNGPTQESPQTQLTGLYPLMWPTLEPTQFDGVENML
ncbi:MAG: hypothetical protein M1834_002672 [Cirrosporium novae-zelandiae]|nr:MAG: hypothetical protein M1834_002672 [Cirrosporium novae-zelandiae]